MVLAIHASKWTRFAKGLRELMMNNRQGVLAQVIRSGKIQVGDRISVRTARLEPNTTSSAKPVEAGAPYPLG